MKNKRIRELLIGIKPYYLKEKTSKKYMDWIIDQLNEINCYDGIESGLETLFSKLKGE